METSPSRGGAAPCQGTTNPPPGTLLAPFPPTTAIGVARQSPSGAAAAASLGLACGRRWRRRPQISLLVVQRIAAGGGGGGGAGGPVLDLDGLRRGASWSASSASPWLRRRLWVPMGYSRCTRASGASYLDMVGVAVFSLGGGRPAFCG
jgi:hypothetical protein